MYTTIDESVFKGIFSAFQLDHLTTNVSYWHESENGEVASYPTVFVPGNNTLMIDGKEQNFARGAFVYEKNGQMEAIPADYANSGGITINGGRVVPSETDSSTLRTKGNIATLKYTPGQGAEPGQLSLTMPEGKGYGFAFRYPASTPEQLADAAKQQNAIVKVKDADGQTLEGFFTRGKGGILPAQYDAFTTGKSLDPGQFVAIKHRPDGSVYVRPYQNYTAKQLAQATHDGKYAPPSDNIANLKTLDGQPLKISDYPTVDVGASALNAQTTAEPTTQKGPEATQKGPEGTQKGPEATQKGPEGTTRAPDGQAPAAPDGQPPAGPKAPGGQPMATAGPKAVNANVPPEVDAPTPSPDAISALGKLAKYIAPVALTIMPAIEGASGGYEAFEKTGSTLDAAVGTGEGVLTGALDTFLPGAKNGYGDVIGNEKLTAVDRVLNAADDITGSATAIGSAAVVAEGAGVITIPATIPTAAVTVFAGISNLGVNVAKGALKATGLAGEDQDGGYLYNGAKAAINGVEHLFGSSAVDAHSDNLLRQSAAAGGADGATRNTLIDGAMHQPR